MSVLALGSMPGMGDETLGRSETSLHDCCLTCLGPMLVAEIALASGAHQIAAWLKSGCNDLLAQNMRRAQELAVRVNESR